MKTKTVAAIALLASLSSRANVYEYVFEPTSPNPYGDSAEIFLDAPMNSDGSLADVLAVTGGFGYIQTVAPYGQDHPLLADSGPNVDWNTSTITYMDLESTDTYMEFGVTEHDFAATADSLSVPGQTLFGSWVNNPNYVPDTTSCSGLLAAGLGVLAVARRKLK